MIEEGPTYHPSIAKVFCTDVTIGGRCVSCRRYWIFSNSRGSEAEAAIARDGDKTLTPLNISIRPGPGLVTLI